MKNNILKKLADIDNKPIVVLGLQKMIWRYLFLNEVQAKHDFFKYGLVIAVSWTNVVAWFVAGFKEDTLLGKIEVLALSYCFMGGLLTYQVSIKNPRLIFQTLNRFQELYDYRTFLYCACAIFATVLSNSAGQVELGSRVALAKCLESDIIYMPFPKYRRIIVACETESVAVFKIFFAMMIFTVLGISLAPMIMYALDMHFKGDAVLSMPIRGVYPWTTESTSNFFITYALQFVILMCLGPMVVSNALTPISMALGLVSLFKITQERFKEIQDNNENALELLKVAIKSHQDSLGLLQMVEQVGRNTYFLIIFMSALAMSLGIFCILNAKDLMTMSLLVILSFDVTFQLFFICWYGQKVIDEVESLYLVVCEVPWLAQSARFRSTFLFTVCRAQRIDNLTAYGFAAVSFETFNSVITTMFSYLTFLQTVLQLEKV